MEYRKLPRGNDKELYGVLGLGMGGIQSSSESEIQAVIEKAVENGINYFDLCAGAAKVYAPFGKAVGSVRNKVFTQVHFGAVYNENGDYAWSRDFDTIRKTFEWELKTLGTDYTDMGFLHCVDEDEDYDALVSAGVLDYIKELKKSGVVRHIGFSSHTPSVASRIIGTGVADMMMFSINPAYDYGQGDDYGVGSSDERSGLFRRCAAEGVGISVMKPFYAGKLLDAASSPFGTPLTAYQCIQYALDRPGVLTVLPGVRSLADLDVLLGFMSASAEERDYSAIAGSGKIIADGCCVYCNHCQPCPAGIDIALVNRYYDLASAGDRLAAGHYDKLSVKAGSCIACGHCDSRCPFKVEQSSRMRKIAEYFKA